MTIYSKINNFVTIDNYDLIRHFILDNSSVSFFISGDNFVKDDPEISSFDFDKESEKIINQFENTNIFPIALGYEYIKGQGFVEVKFNNQPWFFQIKLTPQDAIKENIKIWENSISFEAKAGIREFTNNELYIYNQLVESNNLIIKEINKPELKGQAPWDKFTPTKHKTLTASKPFSETGEDERFGK